MEAGLDAAITKTKDKCEDLQREIERCQEELRSISRPEKYPTTPSDGLHAKLLKLKSEVEVQDPAEFVPPVHEPLLVASDLASELEQTIEQTKRILQVVETKSSTLVKSIESTENLTLQQEQMNEVLLKCLEKAQPTSEADNDAEFVKNYTKELGRKRRNIDAQRKSVKEQMSSFLRKHFPSKQSMPGTSSDLREFMSQPRMTSLEHVIDDLITLAISKPENPYLQLGGQHWDPHVEILLSYGIAQRHPRDIKKIKMSEMHI